MCIRDSIGTQEACVASRLGTAAGGWPRMGTRDSGLSRMRHGSDGIGENVGQGQRKIMAHALDHPDFCTGDVGGDIVTAGNRNQWVFSTCLLYTSRCV